MLKITSQSVEGSKPTLKLEGKLLEPWIKEFEQSCVEHKQTGQPLSLDLSGLSFADTAGTQSLKRLIQQGAVVTNASGFIAALLQRDNA